MAVVLEKALRDGTSYFTGIVVHIAPAEKFINGAGRLQPYKGQLVTVNGTEEPHLEVHRMYRLTMRAGDETEKSFLYYGKKEEVGSRVRMRYKNH